jgi:hypothetical protein
MKTTVNPIAEIYQLGTRRQRFRAHGVGAAVLLRLARKSGKTIEWLLTGKDKI